MSYHTVLPHVSGIILGQNYSQKPASQYGRYTLAVLVGINKPKGVFRTAKSASDKLQQNFSFFANN